MVGPTLEYEAKTILNRGIKEGMELFYRLTGNLLDAGRVEDLQRACHDRAYLDQLFEEFNIKLPD